MIGWGTFSDSFEVSLGEGADVGFWKDKWSSRGRLKESFNRLFHLDRNKVASIANMGE